MTFQIEWENAYKHGTHLNKWPFSEVVSSIYRFTSFRKGDNVLELGFGAGPNISFFNAIGANYHGIEGSKSAAKFARERYPEIQDQLKLTDFTKEIPFDLKFDIILDRGSLTHNSTQSLLNCANLIYHSLADDGVFLGLDWFSTKNDAYKKGKLTKNDPYTIIQMESGCAANLGEVHFSDAKHLRHIFQDFEFTMLKHRIIVQELPFPPINEAYWDFVLKKIII